MHTVQRLLRLIAVITAISVTASASAATLVVNSSGILTGATGVSINGHLYDVQFLEGTCTTLYSGCDANSDFDFFSNSADAAGAGQALLDQVLIDGPAGNFDTDLSKTYGCTVPGLTSGLCTFLIPTVAGAAGFPTTVLYTTNGASDLADNPSIVSSYPPTLDTTGTFAVYAKFTASTSSVPEPATWAMMLCGFGALGLTFRRSQKISLIRVV
ncbi:PEPxxWA-CTERM sorting domain-containing protein [Sphingomonas flavescens]|uniref:PEPxxWA-CTERM sorting domain-containing protein n=1 Tax=Sphingomonas flavescens TaxID=3132797 RepID=UPI0028046043|nr:PEPxxWA-CTERM sorting domain-containing protein [Sphingomonas limnosediminicola]